MLYLLGVLLAVIGIALSIALHEIGHLVPAKKFGLRVPQYMVGFGPTVWSRRRGETEYGIKAIPLGGYIRMIGMFPPAKDGRVRTTSTGRMSQLVDEARQQSFEEVRPEDEGRMFYQLPIWKRIVIMMGGPVMNLLIALVVLGGIWTMNGLAVTTTTVSAVNECVDIKEMGQTAATECTDDMPVAPANEAGLRPGDTITSINGTQVSTWTDVRTEIRANLDKPLTMTVDRDGSTRTLEADPIVLDMPVYDDNGRAETDATGQVRTERAGFLGATGSQEMQQQPITAVPGLFAEQLGQTYSLLVRIPQKLVGVAEAAFGSGERDPEGPMSVVGVGRVAGRWPAPTSSATPATRRSCCSACSARSTSCSSPSTPCPCSRSTAATWPAPCGRRSRRGGRSCGACPTRARSTSPRRCRWPMSSPSPSSA